MSVKAAQFEDDTNDLFSLSIDTHLVVQSTKLTASDGTANDFFGNDVAVSDDTIIVGAFWDAENGYASGSVYVFERNWGGANTWGQTAKITAIDGVANDVFGGSVAIGGNTIVVGADGDDTSGSVYIFERNQGGANAWGQTAKITAADGAMEDRFGLSVAISGDTIIVGAFGDADNGIDSGSAYIFERNQGGANAWGQTAKITAADGATEDWFGISVAVNSDTAIVGAQWDDDNGSKSGSAYIFERNQGGANVWGQTAKITAADGAMDDRFGRPVAISSDTIIVGARYDGDNGTYSGSAYIFERNQGGANVWGQTAKITAADNSMWDRFGASVSVYRRCWGVG